MCMADLRIQQQLDADISTVTSDAGGVCVVPGNADRVGLVLSSTNDFNVFLGPLVNDPILAIFTNTVSSQGFWMIQARDVGNLVNRQLWVRMSSGANQKLTVTEVMMTPGLSRAVQALG